jgi:flavin reductase (DIM6/NTAB) family NADH-FMN oxidoreductase RutF
MPITSFSEAAHYPATMWICVNRASPAHLLLVESGRFTFAMLHQGQAEIAAGGGAAAELYEFGDGFLFVRNALACVACRITQSEPVGDHTLFVAEMLAGVTDSRCSVMRPLLLSDLRTE